LELGGKAANIVYSDAALDEAVEGVVNGIFFNQGHVCCAGSRLLVQEDIEEKFIKKLEKRMQTLNVGNPLDKNTDVGAINSKDQLDKIEKLVNEGVEDGGDLFQIECELPKNGFWFKPSLFTSVQANYKIATVENLRPIVHC
jgi:aldehyde dehydrogenase (NAD+)